MSLAVAERGKARCRKRILGSSLALTALVFTVGCGVIRTAPETVTFRGTVSDLSAVGRLMGIGGSLTICSLGTCSVCNSAGAWGFVVDAEEFPGGDILFTLNGNGVDTAVAVRGIRASARNVVIEFIGQDDGSVVPLLVTQDSSAREPALRGLPGKLAVTRSKQHQPYRSQND